MPIPTRSQTTQSNLEVLHPGDGALKPVTKLFEGRGLKRPHPSTIWRICVRGTSRAGRLPALRILGAWHSTAEALAGWLERGTAAALNKSTSNVDTDEKLRDAGVLDAPPP